METANAISVNVKVHILENSVRALLGMRHLIRYVSFMRHVYNVLLTVNSNMSAHTIRKCALLPMVARSINHSFMMISQVRIYIRKINFL